MEHMQAVEKLMHRYREAREEVMGAQGYADCASDMELSREDREMYAAMSRQELQHAHELISSGDRMMEHSEISQELKSVWHYLKKELHEWKMKIEGQLSAKM